MYRKAGESALFETRALDGRPGSSPQFSKAGTNAVKTYDTLGILPGKNGIES